MKTLLNQSFLFNHLLLCGSWFMFALIHHVMADEKFKEYCRSLLNEQFRYYRFFYSVVAVITLTLVLAIQFSIRSEYLVVSSTIERFLAIPAGIAGFTIMIISVSKYFYRVSGIAALLNDSEGSALQVTGIHQYVRHPLYFGTLLLIWSLFLIFPLLSNLVACVSISLYVVIGIESEERKLVRAFGQEYVQYQQKIPKLIPRWSL